VTVFVGKQGGRKTFGALNEAVSLSLHPTVHLIVVIMKKEYDPTVEAAKSMLAQKGSTYLLQLPYDYAAEYLKRLLQMKSKYNEFIRKAHELGVQRQDISQHIDNVTELFDALFIRDFSRDWLETLIVADDVGNDRFLRDPFIVDCLKLCREHNFTWYINIHSFTQISPSIKQNLAVVCICKGLSRERLNIIYHQTNHNIDRQQFLEMYDAMNAAPDANFLVIDTLASEIHIE
jgi:hypothetical protein